MDPEDFKAFPMLNEGSCYRPRMVCQRPPSGPEPGFGYPVLNPCWQGVKCYPSGKQIWYDKSVRFLVRFKNYVPPYTALGCFYWYLTCFRKSGQKRHCCGMVSLPDKWIDGLHPHLWQLIVCLLISKTRLQKLTQQPKSSASFKDAKRFIIIYHHSKQQLFPMNTPTSKH